VSEYIIFYLILYDPSESVSEKLSSMSSTKNNVVV